jgi:hypothetical protein
VPVLLTGVGMGVVSVEMGNGLIGELGVLVELFAVAPTLEVRCAGLLEAILLSSLLNAWVLVFLAGAWLTGWLAIE